MLKPFLIAAPALALAACGHGHHGHEMHGEDHG